MKLISQFLSILVIFCLTGSATINTPRKVFPNSPSTTSNAESLVGETNVPSQEYYPSVSLDGKFLLYNAIKTNSSASFSNGSLVTKTDKRSIIVKKKSANLRKVHYFKMLLTQHECLLAVV